MRLLFNFIKLTQGFFYTIYNTVIFEVFKVKIGVNWKVNGKIFIRNSGYGGINIGKNFLANSSEVANPIGGDTKLRIITKKKGGIVIGNNVWISNSTLYSVNSIIIEEGVLIGGGCKIWDTDFHSLDKNIRGTERDEGITLPVLIKKKAFLGAGSIVLKGVTIGANVIIGAGSVVTKSVPNNEIWAGNPAKFIRRVDG